MEQFEYDETIISDRIEQLAFLNKGIKFILMMKELIRRLSKNDYMKVELSNTLKT